MSLLDRLFSLRSLSLRDAATTLELTHTPPNWLLVLGVLLLGALAFWSYARLDMPIWARRVLGMLRWASLTLLALLVLLPRVVRPNERVEPDVLLVLADRSASLSIADAPGGQTRDEQLRAAFAALTPEFDRFRAAARRLEIRGFGAAPLDLPSDPAQWRDADAQRTSINASLASSLQSLSGQPLAGVLLLSDGRSADEPSPGLLDTLRELSLPVLSVPLGSEKATPDLALSQVSSPDTAFAGDIVPVQATLELLGDDDISSLRGRVELVGPDGAVLDSLTLENHSQNPQDQRVRAITTPAGSPALALTLATRSADDAQGTQQWTLRLIPEGPDLSQANNQQTLTIAFAPSSMRVLYLDGYPRWEYRYLKNLLLRERGADTTITLLAPDRRSIQEGSTPLQSIPQSASDWAKYDVVILGDLRPGLFTSEQMQGLRDAVSQRGVGLLWIAGAAHTPTSWFGSVLSDLLPLLPPQTDARSLSRADASIPLFTTPILMEPAPAAITLGVLQLGERAGDPWPESLRDPSTGWSRLHWAQRIDATRLKPAVEPIALARALDASGQPAAEASPLITSMRYGAGRVIYVGTDEIWRYRYGRGETLTERIWIPLVRLLARGSVARLGTPATIEASPTRPLVGQSVRIVVRVLDQTLLDQSPASIAVSLDTQHASPELLTLVPTTGAGRIAQTGEPVAFAASFVPDRAGTIRITTSDPLLADLALEANVEVLLPEDELRTPQADHALLARLSSHSGGTIIAPEQAASVRLDDLLPNRERRTLTTPDTEPLWDKPLPWALLLTLLVLEWILRRMMRLT